MSQKTGRLDEICTFKALEPVSVLSFLDSFSTTWDSRSVHKNGAKWLFQHSIFQLVKALFWHLLTPVNMEGHGWEDKLTTYFQTTNYLSDAYTTRDTIVKGESGIVNFK